MTPQAEIPQAEKRMPEDMEILYRPLGRMFGDIFGDVCRGLEGWRSTFGAERYEKNKKWLKTRVSMRCR